jgi:hypothetical protein
LATKETLKPGEVVTNIVTSGDIDSVVIFLFVVARLWPRNEDMTFKNPLFVLLQKPSGTDVYNITAMVEVLEKKYGDKNAAVKIALILCLGGNDYLPKLHGISHSKLASLFVAEQEFYNHLFEFKEEGNIQMNVDKYEQFITYLYCRKTFGDPKTSSFDSVRNMNISQNKDPRRWLPPISALECICKVLNLQIEYYLTAGCPSAPLPDFLGGHCLKKASTGEVEYNFGSESYLPQAELTKLTEKTKPKTPVKKCKKRKAANTPGRIKKIPQISASTPEKRN